MPAQLFWYGLADNIQKSYTTATNSYTKYSTFFGKKAFSTQVGGLAAWISHLEGRKLKPQTIKRDLAGLRSLCFDCTLDKTELKVYSHHILQRILEGHQRSYEKKDLCNCRPITCNTLRQLIL